MFNPKLLRSLDKKERFVILGSLLLILLNLITSFAVRNIFSDFSIILNQNPFGLRIGRLSIFLILLFVTWGLKKFDYLRMSPICSILILGGAWGNFAEMSIDGNVVDYINFIYSKINLADIEIWTGLLILNLQIWFLPGLQKNWQKPTNRI
jgi:lipoprotein signal peptidase